MRLVLLKRFVLLISLLHVVGVNGAEYSLTGYATYTGFTDANWQKSEQKIAINVDVWHEAIAFRAQIADRNAIVQRAVIEYSSYLSTNTDLVTQVGRFPRVASFFNGVTDTPATAGMAVLPMSGYNRRMNTGTFNSADGVQERLRVTHDNTIYTVRGSYGRMVIADQEELQLEAFRRSSDSLLMTPGYTFDLSASIERGPYHVFVSKSRYNAALALLNANDKVAKAASQKFSRALYDLEKIGFQYDGNKWVFETEYMIGTSVSENVNGSVTASMTGYNHYINIRYKWRPYFTSYIGTSEGRTNTGRRAKDEFIGLSYDNGDKWSSSLAFHKGHGESFMRYGARPDSWESFVISTTYRF